MRINNTVRVFILISFSLGSAMAQTATSRIVGAANTFLSTLDQKQRQTVLFSFDDEKQRARWSNLPTSMVPRGGLSFKELTAAQRSAALALGPEVIENLHKRVVTIAQEKKVVEGRKMRVDTTVVETNIHYPTDSSLLGDGVRV